MSTTVKSPYNFVPAPAETDVYKPDWAGQVSHDKPFSDGESGELTLKITAETPIFIRNGHSKQDNDIFNRFKRGEIQNPTAVEQQAINRCLNFSNIDNQYFIPATSLKGMFRNVLEIISSSRMRQINDHRHSIRQIMESNSIMKEGYDLTKSNEKKRIECGYLIREGNEYYVYGCGNPFKIRYTDLDENLNTDFEGQFGREMLSDMNNDFSARTGKYKYEEILAGEPLEHSFEIHPLDGEGESSWKSRFQPLNYVKFVRGRGKGSFKGRIVCVGQATSYKEGTARKGEYVFRGAKGDVISDRNHEKFTVSEDVIKTFLFINRDGEGENEELKDWTYWKNQITTGIPIFFRKQTDTSKVQDMGLTFMYKQPVQSNVKEAYPQYLSQTHEDYKLDLSESIFGNINKKNSLKGRVMFSNCKANGNPIVLNEKSVLLASPKSSFTPFYLQQNGTNGQTQTFNTYNNNPRLRGFKRYPVRTSNRLPVTQDQSADMLSYFCPLDRSTVFSGKVRFHNLRKVEIGALISAITLHNTPNVFHSLGGMKPFGYGRVKVEINNSNGLKYTTEEYLKDFECEMKASVRGWKEVMSELITMSSLHSTNVESTLEHMDLGDFQKIKIEGLYLQAYSEITQNSRAANEYCNSSDVEKRLAEYKQQKIKKQQEMDTLKAAIIQSRSENDFRMAIEHLNQLKLRSDGDKNFSYEKELNAIQEDRTRFERLQIETNRFEKVISSRDISIADKFIQDYPISSYRNEVESHLSRLKATSGIPDRLKNLKDFDMFSKEAPRWLKKLDKDTFEDYREEFISILTPLILTDYQKLKTKRNWDGDFEKVRNWNKVSEWIGEDDARKMYNQVNN